MPNPNIAISYHALDRFKERFPEYVKAEHPSVAIRNTFKDATLERGFLNNSNRIVFMLEKYGDFNYDYYVNGKVVFVTKDDTIITVIHRDDSGMQKLIGPSVQPRFRKRQKCLKVG